MRVEGWTSPAGTRRLLTRLDARESARYAIATRLALPTHPHPGRSFGCDRPGPTRPPWPESRRAWRWALRAATVDASAVLVSDVAACYDSIGERAIRMAAAWAGGDPEALISFLTGARDAGVVGLPIGPSASSFVADIVLGIADEQARRAGVQPVRWVDDVVFAGDRDQVARAARAWRAALGELGLREHEGKRRSVVVAPGAATTILVPSLVAPRGHVIMRST